MDVESDGAATIHAVAEDAWATSQWQNDNRGNDEVLQGLLNEAVPLVTEHASWLRDGTSKMKRIAVGAILDCRAAEWAARVGGQPLHTFECACGSQ